MNRASAGIQDLSAKKKKKKAQTLQISNGDDADDAAVTYVRVPTALLAKLDELLLVQQQQQAQAQAQAQAQSTAGVASSASSASSSSEAKAEALTAESAMQLFAQLFGSAFPHESREESTIKHAMERSMSMRVDDDDDDDDNNDGNDDNGYAAAKTSGAMDRDDSVEEFLGHNQSTDSQSTTEVTATTTTMAPRSPPLSPGTSNALNKLTDALQRLRDVDDILERLGAFWVYTELQLDNLSKKGQLAEQFVAYGHKPRLLARFTERMSDYRRFWVCVKKLCNNYLSDRTAGDVSDSGARGMEDDGERWRGLSEELYVTQYVPNSGRVDKIDSL